MSNSDDASSIDQSEEELFYVLGPKYNWRARCDELNVKSIITKMQELQEDPNSEEGETHDVAMRRVLREKLWEDYNNEIHLYKSIP